MFSLFALYSRNMLMFCVQYTYFSTQFHKSVQTAPRAFALAQFRNLLSLSCRVAADRKTQIRPMVERGT